MSQWEKLNYRRGVWIFADTVFNITYFFHQLCTRNFMSCLSIYQPQNHILMLLFFSWQVYNYYPLCREYAGPSDRAV